MIPVLPAPVVTEALPSRPERLWQNTLERLAQQPDGDLALTLWLPFCATHCLCCDREVRAAPPSAEVDAYVDGLRRELQLLAARLGRRRRVTRLHLAGGSVTELGEVPLLRLFDAVHQPWHLAPGAEVVVHGDPRRFAPGLLRLLHGLGVTRLVLGVHDFDPVVQQASGRRQPAGLVVDACAQARDCGLHELQFDLMLGLPGQTESGWRATLEQVLALAPQQVRLRQYRHRPRQAPVQAVFDVDAVPDRGRCRRFEQLAIRMLLAAGYQPHAADRYLRGDIDVPAADTRLPWLGAGPGASSRVDGRVFFHPARLPDWLALVRAGRLPVTHTRRQVWALSGDRLPASRRRDASAMVQAGRGDRVEAGAGLPS